MSITEDDKKLYKWVIDIEGTDPEFPPHLKHIKRGKITGYPRSGYAYFNGMTIEEARQLVDLMYPADRHSYDYTFLEGCRGPLCRT